MTELSDAFIALPGGLGALEEFFSQNIGEELIRSCFYKNLSQEAMLNSIDLCTSSILYVPQYDPRFRS
jgi:hypothetical protein